MRALVVEVGPEIEQLVFEICRCPEQHAIQILASKSANQPFHEWMGQGKVGEDLISVTSSTRRLACHWWNR
jgi:hypothetical protein